MVFNFFSIRVRLEFSFVLLMLFALLFRVENVLQLVLFASLHELGHIITLLLFKGRIDEINIAFYGIGLKHGSRLTVIRELIFLLSGIAVNGAFALFDICREVNLPLFIINALPVYPLDTGRALSLFLPYRCVRITGVAVTVLLLAFSVITRNFSAFLIAAYIIVFSLKEEIK